MKNNQRNHTQNQIRQGDVFLKPFSGNISQGAKPVLPENGNLILAHGEATGHAHTVTADKCRLYNLPDGGMLLEVLSPTTVMHQEHEHLPIAQGLYFVTRQREYTPDEIRRVAD